MAVKGSVWIDTVYSSSTEELEYKIKDAGNNVLVEGLAVSRPDAPAEVYVNRVAEPFLEHKFSTATGLTSAPDALRVFRLYNSGSTLLETYTFLRAYDGEWNGNDAILSDPVRKDVSANMIIPFTAVVTASRTIKLKSE